MAGSYGFMGGVQPPFDTLKVHTSTYDMKLKLTGREISPSRLVQKNFRDHVVSDTSMTSKVNDVCKYSVKLIQMTARTR